MAEANPAKVLRPAKLLARHVDIGEALDGGGLNLGLWTSTNLRTGPRTNDHTPLRDARRPLCFNTGKQVLCSASGGLFTRKANQRGVYMPLDRLMGLNKWFVPSKPSHEGKDSAKVSRWWRLAPRMSISRTTWSGSSAEQGHCFPVALVDSVQLHPSEPAEKATFAWRFCWRSWS